MKQNICSKTRRNFVSPKEIANQYSVSVRQIYKLLSIPIFNEAIEKVGTRTIRVDQDKFYEIRKQYFG